MTKRSAQNQRKSHATRGAARPRIQAKAIAGKDPVKTAVPRDMTRSLLDAQFTLFKAAMALNPVTIMMRQHAAMIEGFSRPAKDHPDKQASV